jgi:hypothetical protein
VEELVRRLEYAGIAASCAGEVTPPEEGVRVVRGGHAESLIAPTVDPFWPAFRRALDERGSRY